MLLCCFYYYKKVLFTFERVSCSDITLILYGLKVFKSGAEAKIMLHFLLE